MSQTKEVRKRRSMLVPIAKAIFTQLRVMAPLPGEVSVNPAYTIWVEGSGSILARLDDMS